jgi:hypothetical protein
MDCLPARSVDVVRGPESARDAAAEMESFAGALDAEGLNATFFIVPEALKDLCDTAGDLLGQGAEMGMLCHPQLAGYRACLGSYGFDRQREIVAGGREAWERGFGPPPANFRAGFFSANDHTYHAIRMEGFTQGSCSLPGRMDGEQCSMWFGSYPFAHHTDPLDRAARGTMEFLEVPVTSGYWQLSHPSYETYTPPHLRVEEPEVHDYAREIVETHLREMGQNELPLAVVTFVTSNLVRWSSPEDPHVERLQNLCSMLRECADMHGMELRGISLEGLHAAWDEAMGIGEQQQ